MSMAKGQPKKKKKMLCKQCVSTIKLHVRSTKQQQHQLEIKYRKNEKKTLF